MQLICERKRSLSTRLGCLSSYAFPIYQMWGYEGASVYAKLCDVAENDIVLIPANIVLNGWALIVSLPTVHFYSTHCPAYVDDIISIISISPL